MQAWNLLVQGIFKGKSIQIYRIVHSKNLDWLQVCVIFLRIEALIACSLMDMKKGKFRRRHTSLIIKLWSGKKLRRTAKFWRRRLNALELIQSPSKALDSHNTLLPEVPRHFQKLFMGHKPHLMHASGTPERCICLCRPFN